MSIEERIVLLEARIAELERCKHEEHTISAEAVVTIAAHVKADIARSLAPPQPPQAEEG